MLEKDYQIDASAAAVRKSRLKRAMLIRLNALGGMAWEPPRSTSGMPPINFIWAGVYYGFYPSGYPEGKGNDITPMEREAMKRIVEAGSLCTVIANIDSLESYLNLNERTLEIRRLLPRRIMVEQLKLWGAGKAQDSPLEREILALKFDVRAVIFGIYIDKYKINEFAEMIKTPTRTVVNRHERAIKILADRLVSNGTYMEGLGGLKSQKKV